MSSRHEGTTLGTRRLGDITDNAICLPTFRRAMSNASLSHSHKASYHTHVHKSTQPPIPTRTPMTLIQTQVCRWSLTPLQRHICHVCLSLRRRWCGAEEAPCCCASTISSSCGIKRILLAMPRSRSSTENPAPVLILTQPHTKHRPERQQVLLPSTTVTHTFSPTQLGDVSITTFIQGTRMAYPSILARRSPYLNLAQVVTERDDSLRILLCSTYPTTQPPHIAIIAPTFSRGRTTPTPRYPDPI